MQKVKNKTPTIKNWANQYYQKWQAENPHFTRQNCCSFTQQKCSIISPNFCRTFNCLHMKYGKY
jgi:hypothetical protein